MASVVKIMVRLPVARKQLEHHRIEQQHTITLIIARVLLTRVKAKFYSPEARKVRQQRQVVCKMSRYKKWILKTSLTYWSECGRMVRMLNKD